MKTHQKMIQTGLRGLGRNLSIDWSPASSSSFIGNGNTVSTCNSLRMFASSRAIASPTPSPTPSTSTTKVNPPNSSPSSSSSQSAFVRTLHQQAAAATLTQPPPTLPPPSSTLLTQQQQQQQRVGLIRSHAHVPLVPSQQQQQHSRTTKELSQFDDHLELTWLDGVSYKYSYFWLRDNCPCPKCLHPDTQQRLIDTFSLPEDIRPTSARVGVAGEHSEKALQLVWPDGHKTEVKLRTLRTLSDEFTHNPNSCPSYKISPADVPLHWNSEIISKCFPELPYERLMSTTKGEEEAGILEWLELIQRYGFAAVKGVPPTAEATRQLTEKISFLRSTMFGTFWDYTISSSEDWKLQHSDTAYTNLTIDPHTDGSYYLDSPGLQCFHVLDFQGSGGSTVLLDGFQIGDNLKKNNPEAFEFLSTTQMFFRYVEKDKINVASPHTVFRVNDSGDYVQFRYNNHDRAPNYLPPHASKAFYTSIKALVREIQNPANHVRFVLQPGTLLVTNNWRVLHAREEFSGSRRICGCYLGLEDFQSRLRVLRSNLSQSTQR